MRVGFVHPNLGIDGTDGLVVDASLALYGGGYYPVIYTAHFDRTRCFSEMASTPPLVAFQCVSTASLASRASFGRFQVCFAFCCAPLPSSPTNSVTSKCSICNITDRLTNATKQNVNYPV